MWRITSKSGSMWEYNEVNIIDVLISFHKETGLSIEDIRLIENLL